MALDTVRWRLVFARRCLLRARATLSDASPFAPAEAVSAAHDAVELVLRAVADECGYETKGAKDFDKLVDAVPSARAYRQLLMTLNTLRAQAKHHGSAVDRREATRQVELAFEAAAWISLHEEPKINVLTAFLASTLQHRLVSGALEEAEQLLESDGEREAFGVALARASSFVLLQAEEALDFDIDSRSFEVRDWSFHGQAGERLADVTDVVRTLASATEQAFEKIGSRLTGLALGLDRREDLLLGRLLPRVDTRLPSWKAKEGQLAALDASMREKLFLAVVRMAEQAEELHVTLPVDLYERRYHVEALVPAEALLLRGGRSSKTELGELVGHLVVGRHYSIDRIRAPEEGRVHILMFGLRASVPRDAVRVHGDLKPTTGS